MGRFTATVVLAAGVLAAAPAPALSQDASGLSDSVLIDQTTLPNALELKGERPQADPTLIPAAATELPEELEDLAAPPSLALPDAAEQVRVQEFRPLTLEEALQLAEVNSPELKAAASRVDQAKSSLRAAISAWYPTVDLSANGLPSYFKSYTYRNPDADFGSTNSLTDELGESSLIDELGERIGQTAEREPETYARQWRAEVNLRVSWDIIDPARVPQIAAARDSFERARDSYLIALRDLRLQAASSYFQLQEADEGVRIGQASVRSSLVSLRDARARYNAGVNTKLEVLEAETQLARDRNLLTDRLASQDFSRRSLARELDLPQDITPTAATPSTPLGLWEPSLQESIIAAYNYREELDQLILDISIGNSQANASLAAVQPVLSFVNTTSSPRVEGQSGVGSRSERDTGA